MAIRPKHHIGKTRPSPVRPFTDRERYLKIFQEAIQEISRKDQLVLTFYGIGGVGKTSLRRELIRILEAGKTDLLWAVLDFEVPSLREQETALFALSNSLKERYEIQFPTFDLAYAVYWKKTRPHIPLSKDNISSLADGVIADMIRIIGSVSSIPIIGLIPTITNVLTKGHKSLKEWWLKRGKQELNTLAKLEPKEIAERLPMYWAVDFKDFLQKKKTSAVLFIDTYDALWEGVRSEAKIFTQDAWVRELINQMPEALCVICGREKIRWPEMDKRWSKYLKQHLVGELTSDDTRRFLRSCLIVDESLQNILIEASKGVPYYLDLAVDTYFEIRNRYYRKPTADEFARTHQDVLTRFLRYLDKPEIETLKVLSVPRFWNYQSFEHLINEFKTGYPITAFAELCRFSFIKPGEEPDTWTMHQLMRESLEERLDPNVLRSVQLSLFNYYTEGFKEIDIKSITSKHKAALTEAFFHAKSCLDPIPLFKWFTSAASAFDQAAQWQLLIPLYEQVIIILESSLGQDHQDVASATDKLARIHHAHAEYPAAESLYKRSLAIREKIFGQDDPNVAQSLNNLADLLRDQGKYSEAEQLYTKALAIREKAFGQDSYHVAESINNLAVLLWNQGRYTEAEPYFKRAIEIREKSLKPNHPEIAESVNNLAMCYWKQGKYSEAEPLCKRALEMRERTLGPNHHNVAESANNLAMIYINLEQYTKAEPLFKQALEISQKSLSPDHFKTAIFLNNLAMLYWKQHKYAEAEPLYMRALEILERNLGSEHPRVAIALDNLAKLYCSQGRYAEAEPLISRALEIVVKTFGKDHPESGRYLSTLAYIHRDQRKYKEAEAEYKKAQQMWEKAPSQNIPDVISLLNDMAELYRKMGKQDVALSLEKRAKAVQAIKAEASQ